MACYAIRIEISPTVPAGEVADFVDSLYEAAGVTVRHLYGLSLELIVTDREELLRVEPLLEKMTVGAIIRVSMPPTGGSILFGDARRLGLTSLSDVVAELSRGRFD